MFHVGGPLVYKSHSSASLQVLGSWVRVEGELGAGPSLLLWLPPASVAGRFSPLVGYNIKIRLKTHPNR